MIHIGTSLVKFTKIANALIVHNGRFFDDHRDASHPNRERDLMGLVHFQGADGEVHFCPFICNERGFCLNPLYVNREGELHLNRWSVGGVIHNAASVESFRPENYTGSGQIIGVYSIDTTADGRFTLTPVYQNTGVDVETPYLAGKQADANNSDTLQ